MLRNKIKVLKNIKILKKNNQNTEIIKLIEFSRENNITNLIFKPNFIELIIH